MKVKMSIAGELIVTPGDEIEAYALNQWAKNNMVVLNGAPFFAGVVFADMVTGKVLEHMDKEIQSKENFLREDQFDMEGMRRLAKDIRA